MNRITFLSAILGAIAIALLLIPARAMQPWDSQIINTSITNIGTATCDMNIVQVVGGSPRTIEERTCSTNVVLFSSTNATLVFQDTFNRVNSNGGGRIHVTGYSENSTYSHAYNLSGSVVLPDGGHLNLYGDGPERTWFKITRDSVNAFQFVGAKSKDAFFSTFRDFGVQGFPSGSNNRGFYLNTTGFGYIDNLWDNLFLRDFRPDAFYFGAVDCWNNKINNSAIELSTNGMNIGGSVAMGLTCADTKVIGSKFLYNTQFGITSTARQLTVSESFFYKNQQTAFKINGLARAVINNNRFMDNSNGTNNTYYDLWVAGNNNVIVGNQFYGGEPGNNLVKYSIFVDTFNNNNQITDNDMTGGNIGTARIAFSATSQTNNMVINNVGYNPIGKATSNSFYTTSNTIIPNGGNSASPNNNTDTTNNNTPLLLTISGGLGVSISLKDNNGNTIQSGLATLTEQAVPFGYKINVRWVTVPTFTVYFQ